MNATTRAESEALIDAPGAFTATAGGTWPVPSLGGSPAGSPQASPQASPAGSNGASPATSPATSPGDVPARRPRLLVVDDQPLNVQTLYQAFAADHQVLMATRGEQALALCASRQPDLVLLDVVMPGMDGHEVLRRLKADPATREIPVIFVTGQDDDAAEAQGLALGAVDFITKPINPAIVRARVGAHLLLKAKTDLLSRSEGEQRRLAGTLNAVIDALPAHIALLDEHGRITSVNAAWRAHAQGQAMRWSHCDLGQDYAVRCDTVSGAGAACAAHGIRGVLGGGLPDFSLDYPAHSPSEERWFHMSVTPLNPAGSGGTGGTPSGGAVVMHVEKSERKRAELASLLEQTDALILVFDAGGRIETANPAFGHATGWSPPEAAALTAAMWPHPLPARGTQQMRVQQGRRDGSSFTAEWSVSAIFDREGRLQSHVCIGRDVTREEQIQEGLRENDKLRATAVLAGNFAHDFNNLLGSILGLTELCAAQAPEGSRLARNLGRIGQAGAQAATLVRQLLDFSRQTPKTLQRMRVSAWLAQVERLLRVALPPQVALAVTVAEDASVSIDLVQMQQVLLNLASNAAHAMRGREGEIRLLADHADPAGTATRAGAPSHLRLRVVDNGDGIAPDVLKKIFEPFFTTKPVGEGTGLGLAAVHGVITSHGGVVEVESTVGVGTTFSVFLPLGPEDGTDELAEAGPDAAAPGTGGADPDLG